MDIACSPPIYFNDYPHLRNKNVLIVGGTFGVGYHLAQMCLLLDANVTVIGLKRNPTLKCRQIVTDVSKNNVEEYFFEQDYVFNNVGMIWKGRIIEAPIGLIQRFLKVNVETMYLLTQYAIRNVKEVVVNMGSKPKFDKYAEMSLYAMTKHSIIDLTLAAMEEAEQKFYCLCPSRIDTDFRDSIYPDEDKNTRLTPDQVAEHILYLFNGKNPTGVYWLRKLYEKSDNSRN